VRRLCRWLRPYAATLTGHTLLSLDGRVLVVDRVGFFEVASRSVARIALPSRWRPRGVHGITWMGLCKVDRVVVGSDVGKYGSRLCTPDAACHKTDLLS